MASKNRRKNKKQIGTASGPEAPRADHSRRTPFAAVRFLSARFLWISFGLIAANIFIYAQVRGHDFVAWDDPEYLSENSHVLQGLTSDGVRWAFTTGHMGNWHPLTWLSYMLGVHLFGSGAAPHLLTNLVLHIFSSLFLLALVYLMTEALGRSAVVAALFATHPLHVESVAWVSERKDVLSMFFGLLALLAYVEYARRPAKTRYLAVLFLFVLGLMAKPMLITLPFLMLLMDYWPLRRLTAESEEPAPSRHREIALRLLREKVPLFVVAVAASIVTVLAQQHAGAVALLTKVPLSLRAENALVAYVAYLGKMFWPANLSAFYPLSGLESALVVGSALVLLVVTFGVIRMAGDHPWLPVGWFWYLITLTPVIGIVQVGSQAMADRYTYLPLIGIFIALTWEISDFAAHRSFPRALLPVAAGLMIVACALAARTQVSYWKDSTTLWTHALEVSGENDNAHRLLADELAKHGQRNEAIVHYTEALRQNPGNAEAEDGLGLSLADEGRSAEAVPHYREALRLKPDLAEAHSNLGITLAGQGKCDEAITQYSEALRLKPDLTNARVNLGVALANEGKSDAAIAELSEALQLKPDNAEAHNNLAIILAGQGRLDEAIGHFTTAVQLKPDFAAARANLNIALSKRGK